MTVQKQAGFWVAALALLVFTLWVLQEILLPFIAGFVLAYFLDPVADWLERRGLPRLIATLLILAVAVMTVVVVALIVAPILSNQVLKLAQDLPGLLKALIAQLEAVAPQALKDMIA